MSILRKVCSAHVRLPQGTLIPGTLIPETSFFAIVHLRTATNRDRIQDMNAVPLTSLGLLTCLYTMEASGLLAAMALYKKGDTVALIIATLVLAFLSGEAIVLLLASRTPVTPNFPEHRLAPRSGMPWSRAIEKKATIMGRVVAS